MQTLIAEYITCYEHGISSGLFKVSCFQNLPQPAVPPGVRLEDPGATASGWGPMANSRPVDVL